MRITLSELFQAQQLQQPGSPSGVLPAAQPETRVVPSIQVGKQGVVLKHHAHTSAFCGHRVLGAGHLLAMQSNAATGWTFETGD